MRLLCMVCVQVMASCSDRSVRVWDAETGVVLQVLRHHSDQVGCMSNWP